MEENRKKTYRKRTQNKNSLKKDAEQIEKSTETTDIKTKVCNVNTIPANYLVPCVSCFKGNLIYVSKRTQGYQERWSFGQTAYIEFVELQTMVRTDRKFFENNWLYVDDITIVKALGLEKYYKNVLKADEFETIFKKNPTDIQREVSKMSREIKSSIAIRAMEKIEDGTLDSIKIIDAIEKATGYEIREK